MEPENTVVYVRSDRMGAGEDALGRPLLASFLHTLAASPRKPRRMVFVNRGVFLTTEGSEVLEPLRALERAGVEIFSCGTCLDYFHRKETLAVGKVGNMAGTVESLLTADRVVSP
jgi:selenium metabolism protein YedF